MRALDGKVAVITGVGRPEGIGEATAIKLSNEGAAVVITDICRNYEGDLSGWPLGAWEYLVSLEKRIKDRGGEAHALKVDITQKDEVQQMIDVTVREFGRLDILVNNAGTAAGVGPFLEISENAWDKTMEVNVKGTFYCMRAAIPEMLKGQGGRIVNIASTAGFQPVAEFGAYCVSKYAVIGMTQTAALEFASKNILINALCPHIIETALGKDEYLFLAALKGISVAEAKEEIVKAIPIGRVGRAEDVANVVYFLVSPLNSYMVGQVIAVTGGGEFPAA